MSITNQTIDLILEKSEKNSTENALKEVALLIALSKRDKYKMECGKFEKKYKMNFQKLEKLLHSQKGQEDYKKETDLDDWEFAISSLNWWQQRISK